MQRYESMSGLWYGAAGLGLILFVLIQVFPMFGASDADSRATMSRQAAKQHALAIAAERFGWTGDALDVEITYLSDSTAAGYFSKHDLFDSYHRQWDARHPVDVYRADLVQANNPSALTLYLHPESGKLTGWQSRLKKASAPSADLPSAVEPADALRFASRWGENPEDWIWDGRAADAPGAYTFLSRQQDVGEAALILHVVSPAAAADSATASSSSSSSERSWAGGSVTYEIRVPKPFADYLEHQSKLAGTLNALGFVVPQLLLLVMSIVYAVTRRSHTSARRGLWLAAIFAAMYAGFYFNLIPGFRAGLITDGAIADEAAIQSLLVVNFIILGIMALFTYLSAVGGDGLWRSMGRSLWPQWRETAFGGEVVAGMKRGYLLAFLLLGVQSVILAGLAQGIGMFQSSDASQSSYNMTVPWLLLMLAWCAGISEEIQSRLFGIGLFRHWLVGGAARLLGRAPAPRTAAWLTALAMFPPGLFWAFGHVSYAVYPVYSRLIELAAMAMLFGWFMLRFGFLAVLFAHIILNSILMSVQMMADGLPGNLAAGIAGPFLPIAVAYAVSWLHAFRSRIASPLPTKD